MKLSFHIMTGVASGLTLATLATAQPVHSADMIVKLNAGRIVTGRVEGGVAVYGPRVISAEFGDTGIPNATFNPGFDSESGTFPPGQIVGLTIRRALKVWNGQEFTPIPQPPTPPPRVNIIKNNITVTTPVTDPANCGVGSSVILGLVNGVGKIHEHPAYQLVDPVDGVYLLEIELWMSDPSMAVSDPAFIVFNQNSGAFAAAFAWADARYGRPLCYANCDGSTGSPLLTANDFQCFINRFAGGCS